MANNTEISAFTVAEFIEMLRQMPQDAHLWIDYDGYYDGFGGPCRPAVNESGLVVIGKLEAHYG